MSPQARRERPTLSWSPSALLGSMKLSALITLCSSLTLELQRSAVARGRPAASVTGAERSALLRSSNARVERCADCHPREAQGYLQTGMGQALIPARGAEVIERFSLEELGGERRRVARVTHPQTGLSYEASITPDGRWWQTERAFGDELTVEVKYIIGSGRHTRSYLGERDGALVELPLTWYSERGLWAMSPGYEERDQMRFERLISPECLFCHNDLPSRGDRSWAEGFVSATEPLSPGISCDRCHGDGEAHIQAQLTGEGSGAIFNPAQLSPQRAAQLCQQCHLSGVARVLIPGQSWSAYRPELALERQLVVYGLAQRGHEFGVASHGERLAMSDCARAPKGLSCVTCHDPHQPSSARAYREACLSCHSSRAHPSLGAQRQALPYEELEGCVGCHMRRGPTSDIPHVRYTDHWIRARPQAQEATQSSEPVAPLSAGRLKALSPEPSEPALAHALRMKALSLVALQRADSSAMRDAEGALKAWLQESSSVVKGQLGSVWLDIATSSMRESVSSLEWSKRLGTLVQSFEGTAQEALVLSSGLQELSSSQEQLRGAQPADRALSQLAESLLRRALERASSVRAKGMINRGLADLLQLKGSYEEAERRYLSAIKALRHEISAPLNLSALYLSQGKRDEAARWVAEAIRRDPISPLPRYRAALTLLERGALREALTRAEEALARAYAGRPRYAALTLSVELLEALGQPERVEGLLRELIKLEPERSIHDERLAELLWRLGRGRDSLKALEQAAERLQSPELKQRAARLAAHLAQEAPRP